ncbi:MAG: organomercurial lyase [Candidatus Rokuibacteriota bacterium]
MASLDSKSADEFAALDRDNRWRARRAARETSASRVVLQRFLERGGPIPVQEMLAGFADGEALAIREALTALDDDDLIRVRDGTIDVAYPFSSPATPFVVRLHDGRERFACCAVDALGIAPMIGQAIEIRSRCHHCGVSLELAATPEGASPVGSGIMLWIGRRADDRCKIADSL